MYFFFGMLQRLFLAARVGGLHGGQLGLPGGLEGGQPVGVLDVGRVPVGAAEEDDQTTVAKTRAVLRLLRATVIRCQVLRGFN
jgi:hypothetical protein